MAICFLLVDSRRGAGSRFPEAGTAAERFGLTFRNRDFASGIAFAFDGYLDITLAKKARELFAPFDQQDVSIFYDEVVETKTVKFTLGFNAVEIDVINRPLRAAILVHQREGRARDIFLRSGRKRFRNSLHHRRLARTQISAQQNDAGIAQGRRQLSPERDGLLGGMRCELLGHSLLFLHSDCHDGISGPFEAHDIRAIFD